MKKNILSLLSFAAAIAVLIAGIKIFNWIPLRVERDLMKRYGSIEEVRTELNVREILVPSYFPQDLNWPPSTILAQGKPFPAVIMEFGQSGNRETVLVIAQSVSENFLSDGRIKIVQLKEKVKYPLKGRDAVLEVGFGRKGEPCSRISWKEGRYRVTVTAKSTPLELIKVAESMLR